MENHHCKQDTSSKGPFSIAMLVYQSVYILFVVLVFVGRYHEIPHISLFNGGDPSHVFFFGSFDGGDFLLDTSKHRFWLFNQPPPNVPPSRNKGCS